MNITQYLAECVKYKIPVSFSKYGDGEYCCIVCSEGANCDGDIYTEKKGKGLIESFKYMVNETDNAYMGLWNEDNIQLINYWNSFAKKPVRWARYHTILFDENNDEAKANLYRAIKASDMNKIIICNKNIMKSKRLFNADHMIEVPFRNWFDTDFDNYVSTIKDIMQNDSRPPLVITCCGIGAKILICELCKISPNGIFLDFGSGLDKLCTRIETRGFKHSYEYVTNLLKDILPDDWDQT